VAIIEILWALAFLAFSVLVIRSDMKTHEIPNWLNLSGGALALALGVARSLGEQSIRPIALTLVAAVVCFVIYLLIHLIRPSELGGGDVKLAATLGLFLGFLGVDVAIAAVLGAFVLALPLTLTILALKLKKTEIAFGPFMVIAAWVAWFVVLVIS